MMQAVYGMVAFGDVVATMMTVQDEFWNFATV